MGRIGCAIFLQVAQKAIVRIQLLSYFWNEPLISCPFLSSKLDSPVIKTLERHFFTLSDCLSNVLITRESNMDEKNGQLIGGSFLKNNFKQNPYFRIENCYSELVYLLAILFSIPLNKLPVSQMSSHLRLKNQMTKKSMIKKEREEVYGLIRN